MTTVLRFFEDPGSSFFLDPADGRSLVRFAFCKTEELLREAVRRLGDLRD